MVACGNEFLRRLALGLCLATAICQLSLREVAALHFSFFATAVIVVDLFLSQTRHPVVHWRTIIPFGLNVVVLLMLNADLIFLPGKHHIPGARVRSITFGLALLLSSAMSAVILYAAPVPTLPPLDGPFKRVGTCNFTVPISRHPAGQLYKARQRYSLTVQAWFPLSDDAPSEGVCSRWLPRKATLWTSGHPLHQTHEAMELLAASAQSSSLRPTLLQHLALAVSRSEFQEFRHDDDDAATGNGSGGAGLSSPLPLQQDDHDNDRPHTPGLTDRPVLLYSHGMYSWRQVSSCTFELLASHGYVVLACDHSPSAMVTRHYSFDERGDMEGYDYALPDHLEPSTIEERTHYNEGIDTRVHEITALMDFLQTDEARRRFGINSDRFHVMGHSFGAGTMVALACRDKQRVASCVLLDAWMYPVHDRDLLAGLGHIPAIFISSETWSSLPFQAACRHELLKSSPNCLSVTLKGSSHTMYCDLHLLASPALLKAFEMVGTIDLALFVQAENHLILRFIQAAQAGRVTHVLGPEGERDVNPHSALILQQYFGAAVTGGGKSGGHETVHSALLHITGEVNKNDEEAILPGSSTGTDLRDVNITPTIGDVEAKSPSEGERSQTRTLLDFMRSVLVDESSLPHGSARLSDYPTVLAEAEADKQG